ncbi:hypothetical protein CO608_08675 [Lysobacteraceae bacterium NML08-0793]|nr:hypothetical protein CO608_08675 [Xanthomonadaceae bacterium NML08-0793]
MFSIEVFQKLVMLSCHVFLQHFEILSFGEETSLSQSKWPIISTPFCAKRYSLLALAFNFKNSGVVNVK